MKFFALDKLSIIALAMTASLTVPAQEKKLPAPAFTGGMPMTEVVAARRSVREFDSSREINDSTLGQLLWMSVGVNRPAATPSASGAASGRSNPTARNWQEIRAFVFGKNGVWEYRPVSHTLVLVKEGDHRSLVAGTKSFSQDFVMDAPCSIVFVADMTRLPEGGHVRSMALVDAGIACENLNLACVSEGVATVPRATMDVAGLSELLGLTELQIPVMNNPVGYARQR